MPGEPRRRRAAAAPGPRTSRGRSGPPRPRAGRRSARGTRPARRPRRWTGPPRAGGPERPDRAANQRVAPADLARLAGELRRTPVERADLALEAPGRQPLPVGTERQRLDQLGARLEVLAMGRPDQLRMGRDELLEAGPLRHAAAEQQRPQAAVDQERAVGEAAAEALARRADGRGVRSSVPYRTDGRAAGPEMTRPFLLGRVSKGVPLSCRRTCPDLAPCRLDAGRLSWLQRAGPSATLDKKLFGCGAMVPHAARMSKARDAAVRRRTDPQPLQVRRAPALGDVDRVERVEVQVDDAVGRLGDVRREPFEQAVRSVEAAGPDQAGDELRVLDQEPVRVGDPDPGADRQQPLRLGDARERRGGPGA